MGNPVRYGLKNVHIALITTNDAGDITYGKPMKWEGARSLSIDPEGDSETYFADDGAYVVTNANNGYSGTLTMAYMSDEIRKAVFGYVDCGGILVENANAQPKEFALLAQFEEDSTQARRIWYRVAPGRPKFEANTKEDGISPDEEEIPVTMVAVVSGDLAAVHGICRKGKAGYDTFFDEAPVAPTETANA